jgi:zinc protease
MLNRSIAPNFHIPEKISIRRVEELKNKRGASLFFLHSEKQPVVRIELLFHSGKAIEEQTGQAYFAFKMLREGTSDYTSEEIANTLDSYGAYLETEVGNNYSTLTLYCLNKHIKALLPLLKDICYNPTFPEKEIQNQKKQQIQQLQINKRKNSFLASRKIKNLLFGFDHMYAREMEEHNIEGISRSILEDYWKKHSMNYDLIIAGGYSIENFTAIQEALFESNKKVISINKSKSQVDFSPQMGLHIIDKEESLQTSLRIATHSISKNHPDYPKLKVTNHVLGGYFGSRLMKNIREDKGLTYGIYSNIIPMKGSSYILISGDVIKESRELAVSEIQKEITKLKSEALSEVELTSVKNSLIGSFQSDINTPFSLIDKFKSIYLFGLQYDFYDHYIESIHKITDLEIIETANKYFKEDQFIKLLVG